MQSMKFTPLTLFVALLAGCGGSEVYTPPTPLATLVKESAEGAGIAAYITSENLTGLVYNPHSIQNEINDFNADGQSSSTVGIDMSQSSNINGPEVANLTFARGPMLIEDSIPMDKSESAEVFFDEEQNTLVTFQEIYVAGAGTIFSNGVYTTQGPAVSNVPSTGSFNYDGTQFFQGSPGSPYQGVGEFDLTINFDDDTFEYDGTSVGFTEEIDDQVVTASGQLDTSSGVFESDIATLEFGTTTHDAELTGILHGNGATAVTGIFTSTEPQPSMIGAFIGAKQ